MKHVFLGSAALLALVAAGPAVAADMRAKPVYKAPPTAVASVYNWTGFYIGGHVGYGWGDKDWSFLDLTADPARVNFDVDGFLGGGQIGFNWQAGSWVFGLEGEFGWSGIDGATTLTPGGTSVTFSTELNWIATFTGRIGYAWNNWLWYVKGGGAWADEDHVVAPVGTTPATANSTASGWTIGGGAEYGFAPNWSARLEYAYYDFGSKTYTFTAPGDTFFDVSIDQQIHTVKFGVNYRFGEFGKGPVGKGPVVTRY